MNFKNLVTWIESCSYKLFLSNQLDPLGSWQGLGRDVQTLFELPIIKIDLDITQIEEWHPKNNIHTNVN